MKQIHVVAGVIRDAKGRVLLARRTAGRDLAGLWEFPGGKLEPDETPEASLARELKEELGIDAVAGAPVIQVPQQYPDKRLVLDVRQVTFQGVPKGLDGQALMWAPMERLASYPMPPADRPVVAALLQPDRYLVTPEPTGSDAAWLDALGLALSAGTQRVQLRAPACNPSRWEALAEQAVRMCRETGAECLINGDVTLARRLGVGIQLRSAQLEAPDLQVDVKGFLDAGLPVGASCHGLDELRRAEQLGCTFALLGPIKATPTHPGMTGIGWNRFAELREQVALPIYAIGGMEPGDVETARTHGAQGIAAIRGLWPHPS